MCIEGEVLVWRICLFGEGGVLLWTGMGWVEHMYRLACGVCVFTLDMIHQMHFVMIIEFVILSESDQSHPVQFSNHNKVHSNSIVVVSYTTHI